MVDTPNPSVYPCGRGILPGTQGPGGGGELGNTGGSVWIPKPPLTPDPPFTPVIPPQLPAVKCVEISPGEGAPNADPGFTFVNPPYRQCMPCDGTANTITDPRTGLRIGEPKNPNPGDAGCIYVSLDDCRPNCLNPQEKIIEPGQQGGPITGGPSVPQGPITPRPPRPTGPTTGGTQYYKCDVVALGVCPGQEGIPLNQALVTTVFTECRPCSPNYVNANGTVVPDPNCTFSSLALCEANCTSPTFTNVPCPPTTGPITGDPNLVTPQGDPIVVVPIHTEPNVVTPGVPQVLEPQSPSLSTNVSNQANEITNNQQLTNGKIISASELVEEEDYKDIRAGISQPSLFDPNLNFFKTEPTGELVLVPNNFNRNVFKSQVAEEVSELLNIGNSTISWNEVILQNLSDDKLLESLNPRLANTFQYLRHPGGEPVGVSTLLNVVRKHLLQGTINEFDPNYYLETAESQLNQKFDVLEKPSQKELSERLAIKFLINNLNTYGPQSSKWQGFQINRARPLNEDAKLEIDITTLDGTVKDLSIPNDGFDVSTIVALGQVTIPALGSPDKLNIGDGGGYYIDTSKFNAEVDAVYTNNIISDSYYAPPPVRAKVLKMLDIDSAITITASSVQSQHEFISGDPGASAVKPLYFTLDLSSVSGATASNSLVENYIGTYRLLTSSTDIQRHLNNNALNTAMLSVDYRDPLYRYILDTSSFTAELNDFNLNGFADKAFSSIGSRFVRNIPFGFVVTPVAGGKYNPFNGNSTLTAHGNTHVRSLSVIPAVDSSIDGNATTMFESYFLKTVSGVDRVGNGETSSEQNIGYRYLEDDFTQTFYSASSNTYGYSSTPVSAQGTAYLLREVIDYLSATYNAATVTWYDVFSRMPVTRMGEVFYDSDKDLIRTIANGFRGGIKIQDIEAGYNTSSRIIEEDSKTVVFERDRANVTKIKI